MTETGPKATSAAVMSNTMDRYGLFSIACVMAIAFLVFDLILPLGVAGGVSYVAVILLGLWFPFRNQVAAITVVAVLLTVLGYFLSPEGGVLWKVLLNRGLALFAIVSTGAVIYFAKNIIKEVGHSPEGHGYGLFSIACVMAGVFLVLDLILPLGIAGGVSYVAIILIGLWFPSRNQVAAITVVAVLLTVLGYFLSPEGGVLWKVLLNRGLALFAIMATGGVIYSSKKAAEDAVDASEQSHEDDAAIRATPQGAATGLEPASTDPISIAGYRGLAAGFPVLLLIVGIAFWIGQKQEQSL